MEKCTSFEVETAGQRRRPKELRRKLRVVFVMIDLELKPVDAVHHIRMEGKDQGILM